MKKFFLSSKVQPTAVKLQLIQSFCYLTWPFTSLIRINESRLYWFHILPKISNKIPSMCEARCLAGIKMSFLSANVKKNVKISCLSKTLLFEWKYLVCGKFSYLFESFCLSEDILFEQSFPICSKLFYLSEDILFEWRYLLRAKISCFSDDILFERRCVVSTKKSCLREACLSEYNFLTEYISLSSTKLSCLFKRNNLACFREVLYDFV